MFDGTIYLQGLAAMGLFGLVGWGISVYRHNVTIVDSMWSLFLLLAASVYAWLGSTIEPRTGLVLALVTIWALRLSIYLSWRNRGPHEDHRYQAIRRNNEPHFWLKSLYIIFGLQAVLAWLVSLPLLGSLLSSVPLGWLDVLGVVLWLTGLAWETLADWQLARFKASAPAGAVMNRGVWRYSRHPNYFGEFCIWWGFYLLALSAGAWWTLPGPLLMTLLLLKVSGVALLEKDIGDRRPAYAEYVNTTSAFFPWFPKSSLPEEQ
jgi:steroid 5-alpha reductase family enzyme